MSVTQEQLAAFADGELTGAEEARVAAAIDAEPALAEKLEQHLALRASLSAHFASILEAKLPDRLTAPLFRQEEEKAEKLIDFAQAREKIVAKRSLPRWSWIAGPALAASLAIAVFLPRGGEDVADGYAGPQLASALDQQLVAAQTDDAQTRILVSFQREGGDYCRAFASSEQSGIACRNEQGWELVAQQEGIAADRSEFRQAGNPLADLLAIAQDMAVNGALGSQGEADAREAGWVK